MAWTHLAQIANGGNTTGNQTSFTLTTTAAGEVGHVLFLGIGKDNDQAASGNTGDEILTVTDSVGNLWFRANEWANAGTVQTTTACALWWTQVTVELPSGGTVTAQFGGVNSANDAQCGWIEEFSVESGSYVACIATTGVENDAADPGAISLSSIPNIASIWIHVLSGEGESTDAYTWDSDYTQITVAGANSGSATTSQHVTGGYRIQTATSDTVDVASTTADRDYAQVLAVFIEVIPVALGGSSGGGKIIGGGF